MKSVRIISLIGAIAWFLAVVILVGVNIYALITSPNFIDVAWLISSLLGISIPVFLLLFYINYNNPEKEYIMKWAGLIAGIGLCLMSVIGLSINLYFIFNFNNPYTWTYILWLVIHLFYILVAFFFFQFYINYNNPKKINDIRISALIGFICEALGFIINVSLLIYFSSITGSNFYLIFAFTNLLALGLPIFLLMFFCNYKKISLHV